jgi:BirA family biotin operon repressor/biotin-[acetyl-CoA-carboxylase] ligase
VALQLLSLSRMNATADPALDDARKYDCLSIELVRRHLDTDTVGAQMFLFWQVASTNQALRQLAEAGAQEGTVVLAETQTAGRGRLGKTWFSPAGVNLYASVLFRPRIPLREVGVFSLIASLALSEAMWAEGAAAGIKWPNDIVVDGRKVAGTLVTCASAGDLVDYVILGVGVNLNTDSQALGKALGEEAAFAASVGEVVGRPVDRNTFTATFLNLLEKWLLAYRQGGAPALLAPWRERDVLCGRTVAVVETGRRYQGCVVGMDHEARLEIVDAYGIRRHVVAGEVRLVG